MICFLRQIGTAHIANKQGITAEQTNGGTLFIFQQVTGTFHGMTGCMQCRYSYIAYGKNFTVGSNMCIERWRSSWTIYNSSAGCFCQIEVTGNKISMKM